MSRHFNQPIGGCTKLDDYNNDLNLEISSDKYSCKPMTKDGFAYMWAGAKANFGLRSGKVCYEVKITDHLEVTTTDFSDTHVVRVGWSVDSANLQLGEDKYSFGFGGTAKKSEGRKFSDYGRRFGKGDVISCYLMIENGWADISYCINGRQCGSAFKIRWQTNEALFPHVLTKNCSLELNFGQASNPYFSLQPGYKLIDHIPAASKVPAISPPPRKSDCEVIMMVGLPGVGKSTWAMNYAKIHPSKKYNILGTDAIIEKMRVLGLPRKNNFGGRWDVLIKQASECFNVLLKKASDCNRNVVLDQTNVYASARKRKATQYKDAGYMVHAMVLVPSDGDMIRRSKQRTIDEGKEIPEAAVLDMKANFSLPHQEEHLFSSITFLELQQEEAEQLVLQYNAEASLKGHKSNKKTGVSLNQNQQEKNESSSHQSGLRHSISNSRDGQRGDSKDSSRNRGRETERKRSQLDEGGEKNKKSSRSEIEPQKRSDSGSRYEPLGKYRRNSSSSPYSNSPSKVSRDRYNTSRERSPSKHPRHDHQHHEEKNYQQEKGHSFKNQTDNGLSIIQRKDSSRFMDSPSRRNRPSSIISELDSPVHDVSKKIDLRPLLPRNSKLPQNQASMNYEKDVLQQDRSEFSYFSQNKDTAEHQNYHEENRSYSENYENRYESSRNDHWNESNQEWSTGENQRHDKSKSYDSGNESVRATHSERSESWDRQNMQSHEYFDDHDHPVQNYPDDFSQDQREFIPQRGPSSVNFRDSEGAGDLPGYAKFGEHDDTFNQHKETSIADNNFQPSRNMNYNSSSAMAWSKPNTGAISQRNMAYGTQDIDSWMTEVNQGPEGNSHLENQNSFAVKQEFEKEDHSTEFFNPNQMQRGKSNRFSSRTQYERRVKWENNAIDYDNEGPEEEQHDAPLPEISHVDFNKLKASLANIKRNNHNSHSDQDRGSEDYFSGYPDSSVNFENDNSGNIHGTRSDFEQFSDESHWDNKTEDHYNGNTMQDTVQHHHPSLLNDPIGQGPVFPLHSAAVPYEMQPSIRSRPRGNSRPMFPRVPRISDPSRARKPLLDTPHKKLLLTEEDFAYQPQGFDENGKNDPQPIKQSIFVPRANLTRNCNPQNLHTHLPSGPRFRLPSPQPRLLSPGQKQPQWNQQDQRPPAPQSILPSTGQHNRFQQRQRAPAPRPRMTSVGGKQLLHQRPLGTRSRMVSAGKHQSQQPRLTSPGQQAPFQHFQRPSRPRMTSPSQQLQFHQRQRPPTRPRSSMPSSQQQQFQFQQRQRSLTPQQFQGQNDVNFNAPRNSFPNANMNRQSIRMNQPRNNFMRIPSRGIRPRISPGPRPMFQHSRGTFQPRNFRPPFPKRNY